MFIDYKNEILKYTEERKLIIKNRYAYILASEWEAYVQTSLGSLTTVAKQ
jgi:hypothetical protein